ncbi:MAG: restriction endonuclease subunit S [Rhodanobacter sp.]
MNLDSIRSEVRDSAGSYVLEESGGETVPAGYKRTEVGVIPQDWSTSTVAQEFEIKLGKMLDAEKNRGSPKPYIGNKAVQWGRIDVSDLSTMAMSKSDTELFRLQRGDVLVCEGGEVGRAAIWDAPIEECYFQKALHRLRPTRGFDTRVIVALLRYWSDHGLLANYVTQTSIAHLTREKFAQLPLPVPGREEQHAIATALSDVDALLAKLDQLIAKKHDLKQAAMQQLLTGQTRLPGFVGDWVEKSLLELAAYKKELFDDGDWIETEYLVDSGIRLIQTGNIGEGHFIDKNSKKYISGASFEKLRCKEVKTGDLLICRLAEPAGRACIMPDIGEERVITAVDVTIFRPPVESVDRRYLIHVFNTPSWFASVNERCGGSTRTRIARGALGKIQIKLPSFSEQAAIANILSDMDAELAALETRRAKTRELKQGMMQALLTGRIRLV